MRLTPREIETIRETTAECFGPDARVWLFGSRIDDAARGGDIDLFVETAHPLENRLEASLRMHAKLILRLGEQKIDVIVADPTTPTQPIHEVARHQGIPL